MKPGGCVTEFYVQFLADIIATPNNNQRIGESEHDHHMEDDSDETLHPNDDSCSPSKRERIDSLRLQEMENRVTESQLRCDVQKLIVSKAEEEFKHLQEMNKVRLQEAKIRLKLLERHCANVRGNFDPLNGI